MSKREIERALRAKGIKCETLEYNYQVTPGEMVGGWDIVLTEECEEAIADLNPEFSDWEPDCRNTSEVLEWIETLPAVSFIAGVDRRTG